MGIHLIPLLAQAGALVEPPQVPSSTVEQRLQSLLGLVAFTLLALAIGYARFRAKGLKFPRLSVRTILWGFILQFACGFIVTKNRAFLIAINNAIDALLGFTAQGADM